MESIIEAADRGDVEAFTRIKGIGEKTARIIIRELTKPIVRSTLAALKEAGLSFAEKEKSPSKAFPQIFRDEVWCVTGSFEHFKPRSLAVEEIEKRGGRTVSAVTGKTTHLLAGTGGGSKRSKAAALGIPVISEDMFIRRLKGTVGENHEE